MAKISAKNLARLIQVQDEVVPHLAAVIKRRQENCPNLPNWFTEKSVDFYTGLLESRYSQIEDYLHDHNMYGGFNERTVKVPEHNTEVIVRVYYFKR